MDTLKINPNSRYDRKIRIGFEGENAVSRVDFDMADWQTKYGEGSLVLFVIRPRDTVPYPVSLSIVDGTATWNITSTDCARHGSGAIQLKYTVGSVVKKSYIYATSCSDALDETDTVPDGYTSWLATLTDLSTLVTANAQSAAQSASNAQASAESAEQSASAASESASASAESAQSASESASQASESANRAKASEEAAQGALAGMTFVSFTVDENGHVLITNSDLLGTTTFELAESGHMEVTY